MTRFVDEQTGREFVGFEEAKEILGVTSRPPLITAVSRGVETMIVSVDSGAQGSPLRTLYSVDDLRAYRVKRDAEQLRNRRNNLHKHNIRAVRGA